MSSSSTPLQQSWEVKLAAVLLLLLLIVVGLQFARLLREAEPPVSSSQAIPPPRSLLGDQAFAFLYPPVLPGEGQNPFRFLRRFPKPQANPVTTPQVVNNGDPSVPRPTPTPPKPLRRLFFSGWIEAAEGPQRTAFIEIADARSGAVLHRGPVRVGAVVAGFTVLTLEATTAKLRDPAGQEHVLALRKPLTIEQP